ncbi:MAG: toll/interleukin-1 receptor domain-containing protein, partial [Rhodocyclaceae bacterium]
MRRRAPPRRPAAGPPATALPLDAQRRRVRPPGKPRPAAVVSGHLRGLAATLRTPWPVHPPPAGDRPMSFERQVFISYAHLDNQPLTADQLGWVSLFHSTLQTLLSQRLGAPVDIWRDDKLRGNDVFSDEILDQLSRTALFVSVLTPRYLKSEWCTREITKFCQQAESEHRLVVGNKARVIKVLKLPIDGSGTLPEAVGQLLGYEFFEFDEDRTPRELDPAYGDQPRQAFLRKANKLAWDLAAQLEQLQQQPAANDAAAAVKPTVFLAECSRDRRDARECIEAELACCGYTVLPDRRLP